MSDLIMEGEKIRAQITKIDENLLIVDTHQPTYKGFLSVSKEYCPNHFDSATSKNSEENKKNAFRINEMDVEFKSNYFIPLKLGQDSLVETDISEIAPVRPIQIDIPTPLTLVVHHQSDYILKFVPIQVNLVQWKGTGTTTKIDAQRNTGVHASVTNNLDIIHDYKP